MTDAPNPPLSVPVAPVTTIATARGPAPWKLAGVTALVAGATGFLAGRGTGRSAPGAPPPTAAAPARTVRLAPAMVGHAGIRTARVAAGPMLPSLAVAGSVQFDPEHTAQVGARIDGRITRLYAEPGDTVRAGQVLCEIESADLGEALAEYHTARAHRIAAQAQLARETSLAGQQLTTASAVEAARAESARWDAELRGAELRLLAMGLSDGDIRASATSNRSRSVVLRAPLAGRVVERQASLGQTVEATDTLFRIGDTAHLWIVLDVFERDLERVHEHDPVEVRAESMPDERFRGEVQRVEPTVDPATRAGRIRIEIDNSRGLLRPGQWVSARVRPQDDGARQALRVARTAIVQIEGRPAVFVALGPTEFEPRNVETGAVDGDDVEVTRGLDAGETIVTTGAFALKSELLR